MNPPVYLGLWDLDISQTIMYECYYGYIKPIYFHKAKLCYMDPKNDIARDAQKKIWCNGLQEKQIIAYKDKQGYCRTYERWFRW